MFVYLNMSDKRRMFQMCASVNQPDPGIIFEPTVSCSSSFNVSGELCNDDLAVDKSLSC